MKFKKIIIFLLVLFLILTICFATNAEETLENSSSIENLESGLTSRNIEIDYSSIANNFNNSTYVAKLKELGINVKAVQKDNNIILTYNNSDTVTFSFDSDSNLLSTIYTLEDKENKDILSAILVDTVSSIQGNEVGDQLPFYFDDAFCYSYYQTNGISKDYISSDLGASVNCIIKINTKMDVPLDISSIDESTFTAATDADNLYSKKEYFIRKNGLVFYKKYSDDGKLEIYIGQAKGFNEHAYKSVLNYLTLLYDNMNFNSPKVLLYMKQNYTGFDNGNAEFDGVKIDTEITELPINNQYTVLVGNNMKYAKLTIDEDLLKDCAAKVSLTTAENSSVNSLSNSFRFRFFLVLLVIFAVLIIFWIIYKIKNK